MADAVDLCGAICGGLDEAERAVLETAARQTFESVPASVLGDVAFRWRGRRRSQKSVSRV